ncbi:MAG: ABC transporter substrate-binding protein, partial [Nocardioidaceae bacterium]|nr:ABC transporter substrate-binding protein [Nocardioidaceae bacterium]
GTVDTGRDVSAIPADRTLNDLLVSGEIDCLQSPRVPSSYVAGDPRVRRLFPDVVGAERDYYAATGIFPIMHVVVLRREVHEAHPWVARSLTKALTLAKDDAYRRIYDTSALRFMVPWLTTHVEEARSLLGPDYWSYGVGPNRHALEVFLRYHHEQGLSSVQRTPDELFAPASLESFVI